MLVHNTRTNHFYISTPTLWLITAFLVAFAAVYTGVFNSSAAPAATNRYQTFYSPHYNYSIDYPADWQVVDQTGLGVFSATSKQQQPVKPDQGGTNFSQRKMLNDESVPAAGFSKIDVIADELESPLSAQDYMLAKVGTTPQGKVTTLKIGGQDAVRIDVQSSAVLDNHTDNTIYSNFYVTNGNYGYIIAGFASPSVLNHIINSLTFVK
ncbi:MAG: hypothetical protein J0I20_34730 [Chloroflexi bacterium]|nr:hypothetical protein [Chloroflexota bacterium]OJV89753.1 MAG: hypothetical protein BGO39_28840 [Chloroflexi bacterium 54-19]